MQQAGFNVVADPCTAGSLTGIRSTEAAKAESCGCTNEL